MITTAQNATAQTCEQLPPEAYHADAAIGASALEDFRKSRRLFESRYVTKTAPPKEPTPAMELGTAIHLRILEPNRYSESIVVAPADAPDRRSRNYWADLESQAGDKQIITFATSQKIEAITQSVLSKRWASRLLRQDGQPELSIFWTDPETGLNLKCRVDWFSTICIDLKTTADPSPGAYVKTLVNLGYHRKLSHYRAGISAYTESDATFIHIAAGTEAPYPCGAYSIDDRDLMDVRTPRLGEKQWRKTLRALAECFDSGDFSDPFEREILDLRLPQYAFTEDSYQL